MSGLSDALYEVFSWLPNTPPPEDRQRVAKAIASALAAPSAATGSGAATGPRDEAVVAKIRDYVVAAIATCREAEEARLSDMGKRAENHAILPMLREQHFAWGEKVKSYDALLRFIDDAQRGAR